MYKNVLIVVIVAFVLLEIIEHLVVPLIGFLLSRKKESICGAEGMVGLVVEVKQWSTTKGQVFVNGELWRALSDVPLLTGDKAVVQNVGGLTLRVKPCKD